MKKIIRYQCEVCESFFETEEMATECENIGIEKEVAKKGEIIHIKMEYGSSRAGRVLSIETKGHQKDYKIGIFPQSNGMHFDDYEMTLILKGNKEAALRIVPFNKV